MLGKESWLLYQYPETTKQNKMIKADETISKITEFHKHEIMFIVYKQRES